MNDSEAIAVLQCLIVELEKAKCSKTFIKMAEFALDIAIEAIRKREPVKPWKPGYVYCGKCENRLPERARYCPWCGQAVQWDD